MQVIGKEKTILVWNFMETASFWTTRSNFLKPKWTCLRWFSVFFEWELNSNVTTTMSRAFRSHDVLWCLHNKWGNVAVKMNRSARANEEIKVSLGLICKKKRKKEKIQQPFLTAVPGTLTPSVCWVCLPLLLLVTHVAVSIRNKSLNGNATLVFVRFSLSEQISSLWIPSTLWGNAASVGCVFYSSILLPSCSPYLGEQQQPPDWSIDSTGGAAVLPKERSQPFQKQ